MPTGHYDRSQVDYGTAVCPGCGTEFRRGINQQKWCSPTCREHHRADRRPGWKSCVDCGREYHDPTYSLKRTRCDDCLPVYETAQREEQARRMVVRPRNLRKVCAVCGKKFVADRGHQKYCSATCKATAKREREAAGGKRVPSVIACEGCGKEFQQNRVFQRFCSHECWRNHPETRRTARNKGRWYAFGVDLEAQSAWRATQDDRCEVCWRELGEGKSGVAVVIDHDHTTGLVRGLICKQCNAALGRVRDDPEVLRRLVKYLSLADSPKRRAAIEALQQGDPSLIDRGQFPRLPPRD